MNSYGHILTRALSRPFSRRGLLISAASLLPAARLLRGQAQQAQVQQTQAQQTQAQADSTFSTSVKVVNVLATVRNGKGELVHELTKDDFLLEEEGHPQTITYFSRDTNLPLTLGLLVDTSASQRRVLDQEKNASREFLRHILREDQDHAFLIHFEREVELLQDLTSSRSQLETALNSMDAPRMRRPGDNSGNGGDPNGSGYPRSSGGGRNTGGTALYDAVLLASDELMAKQMGRKALIVLSDGVDNASKTSLSSAIESAQRADTAVYSIYFSDESAYGGNQGGFGGGGGGFGGIGGLGGGMGRRGGGGGGRRPPVQAAHPDGKKILERISRETGGALFEVTKKHPLDDIYDKIEAELRNQYNLGFTPDAANGSGFRRLHVTTKTKGLTVQARDGYYYRS